MMKYTVKEEIFVDQKKRQIPMNSWLPAKSKAQLIVLHGFSQHMGYYQTLAKRLNDEGIAVHMMDLPGHGKAGGIRGHIGHFNEYLDTVDLLLNQNPHILKTKPKFLFGHSLGGLIAFNYCLQRKHTFKGVIATSPLTGFPPLGSLPILLLVKFLARKQRNIPFPKPAGVKTLSRNPKMWTRYYSDPYRGRLITPNLYLVMDAKAKKLHESAAAFRLPLLMFIASQDKVVSPEACQRFFGNVSSTDKSLVVFSQAMHELLQEEESTQILETMTSWIEERL